MDNKENDVKTNIKSKISSFFNSYIGMYIDDIPSTKAEIIENLPNILNWLLIRIGCIILGSVFGAKAIFYSAMPLGTAMLCSSRKYVSYIYLCHRELSMLCALVAKCMCEGD
jgi:hypothetical protein